MMESSSKVPIEANSDSASYESKDIIRKDVFVIGGGCSGAYIAIRLQDFDKSVVVVEMRHILVGHASTYTDPGIGTTLDVGVIVFVHFERRKN